MNLETARALDANDPLARWRAQFHVPRHSDETDCIYLCGNSLGLQPVTAGEYVAQELKDWRELGVEGHFHARRPWLAYHAELATHQATLVGAAEREVVAMNTLTVNLHLLMVSFYRPTAQRYKIVIESGAFPSDRFAVRSQLAFHGHDPDQGLIELAPRAGEHALRTVDIEAALERDGDAIALVLLPGVQYYTGEVIDMARVCEAAHAHGCVIGFDLAHAAGNVELALHDWGADFAVWCTYKYLNGGPGAVAGCFVHARHAESFDLPRFCGWWGHDQDTRFEMGPDFVPMPGAEGWQLSNPPILALAPVLASLEIFTAAGMGALRKKALELGDYFLALLDSELAREIEVITPREPARRGCQLSLRLRAGAGSSGRAVFDRITAAGVICDWREPDVIRLAPVPLYNRFEDVYRCTQALQRAVVE